MQFQSVEPVAYKKPISVKERFKKKTPSAARNPSNETAQFLDFIARDQDHKLELYSYAAGSKKLPEGIVNNKHYKSLRVAYKEDVIPLRRKLKTGICCVNDMIAKKQTFIFASDHRVGNLIDGNSGYEISELTDELYSIKDQIDEVLAGADFPLWACVSVSIPFVEPPCEEACEVVIWKEAAAAEVAQL